MSRVQLALRVADLEASVAFYTRLFGTEPAKRRPGYANFAIAEPPLKLVLLEGDGEGDDVPTRLDHLRVGAAGAPPAAPPSASGRSAPPPGPPPPPASPTRAWPPPRRTT